MRFACLLAIAPGLALLLAVAIFTPGLSFVRRLCDSSTASHLLLQGQVDIAQRGAVVMKRAHSRAHPLYLSVCLSAG
jgi:hypothetical protein